MPIFRINADLHYFAHVPKCGGTSVETYLTTRFGRMAFHEPGRHRTPERERWDRSSGEHIPVAALDRLVPPEWLASSFAVVRHPVRRLISAFFYNRLLTRVIPAGTEFNAWFKEVSAWIPREQYPYGSHLARQTSFVPAGSRIFRLEDGLDQIVPYLDRLAGNADGPRHVPATNVGTWREDEEEPELTEETLARIAEVYAPDFARFGYEPPISAQASAALPDLPVLAQTGRPPAPPRRPLMNRIYRNLIARVERQ